MHYWNIVKNNKIFALLVMHFYIVVEFMNHKWLDSIDTYAVYYFEAIFVAIVFLLYREDLRPKSPISKPFLINVGLALLGGFTIYQITRFAKISIPLNLGSAETIVFLLLIAPILEELLFRQALWSLLSRISRFKWMPIVATASMFAYGHFYAYYSAPESSVPFIIYQTSYTFIFGLWFGVHYYRHKNILYTMGLHAGFNLGFFIAFLIS